MRHFVITVLMLLAVLCYAQPPYPAAPVSNDTIKKFGYEIPDPFRPLEDVRSAETQAWLKEQEERVRKYRNNVFADYTVVEREFAYTLWSDSVSNYLKSKIGAYYFRTRYDYADDNSPVIEFRIKLSHGWRKVLSTAQFLRDKEDVIHVQWLRVSIDDSTVAIGLSHKGSDWTEIYLVDMNTQKLLPEKLEWTKYGIAWAASGFFYNQYEKPEGNTITTQSIKSRVMYHRLGAPVANDRVISEDQNERSSFYTTPRGKYFVLYEKKAMGARKMGVISYVAADSVNDAPLRPLVMAPGLEERDVVVLGEVNGSLLAHSFFKAPRGAIIKYDRFKTNSGKVMIEMFNQTLLSASLLRDRLFCTYMDAGKFVTLVFDTTGKAIKTITAPEGMCIEGFDRLNKDSITYYFIRSFSMPQVTMRFNLNSLQSELPDDNAGFALSSKYLTKIVSYYGKDSTKLYMYLTYDKDKTPDPSTPVLMYAYGGFNVPTLPDYNPMYGMILRRGGILAVPLVRGGGEFGTAWHDGGKGRNKQNSVDDLCAAAEWLIANKYTSAEKIAATGGSQGGWLIGTAAVQHPELFKAVVPMAGVYDMIRYHLFSSLAVVGLDEFGNPDDEGDFPYLYKISAPYHIKEGVKYPSSLIIIGSDDDRVVPFHSFKLAAALQKVAHPQAQHLLYLEENVGHNVTSASEGFQQISLMYTFIMRQLGMRIQ